jgi:hypothetical protein
MKKAIIRISGFVHICCVRTVLAKVTKPKTLNETVGNVDVGGPNCDIVPRDAGLFFAACPTLLFDIVVVVGH